MLTLETSQALQLSAANDLAVPFIGDLLQALGWPDATSEEETNPAIVDITPRVWPVQLEECVSAQGLRLFTISLQEDQEITVMAFACEDIDLRVRDRFGVTVAEDMDTSGRSLCALMAQGTGEYLIEVINRSNREVLFGMRIC